MSMRASDAPSQNQNPNRNDKEEDKPQDDGADTLLLPCAHERFLMVWLDAFHNCSPTARDLMALGRAGGRKGSGG